MCIINKVSWNGGIAKSSKSLDHDLLLKSMVTSWFCWGISHFKTTSSDYRSIYRKQKLTILEICIYIYILYRVIYIYNYILYILGACGFGKRDIAGAGGVAAILGDLHLAEIQWSFAEVLPTRRSTGPFNYVKYVEIPSAILSMMFISLVFCHFIISFFCIAVLFVFCL